MAMGRTEVVGHPLPRTAHKYSLNKDWFNAEFAVSVVFSSSSGLGLASAILVVGASARVSGTRAVPAFRYVQACSQSLAVATSPWGKRGTAAFLPSLG